MQALLIFSAIPLSAIGGIFALWLRNMPFSISAGVGFIALFGVSVQNAIIMVANFRRVSGEGLPLDQTVLTAATERLRPVLMTATVASIGMLPAAMATGVGTDVQRGLATVVVGGLIVSTFLTLFILPTLYFSVERFFAKSGFDSLRRRAR
jgi:cobalt-zinc-cadmium resistance protein CzcA